MCSAAALAASKPVPGCFPHLLPARVPGAPDSQEGRAVAGFRQGLTRGATLSDYQAARPTGRAVPARGRKFVGVGRASGPYELSPLPLDCLRPEEAIDRDDTAASRVGIPEHRQLRDGLCLGIDGLAAALRIFAPVRDQAPFQKIERPLVGLMVCRMTRSSWLGAALNRRGTFVSWLSRTSRPSTIARRSGPEAWMTRPHMRLQAGCPPLQCLAR